MKKDRHTWHSSYERNIIDSILEHLNAFHAESPYKPGSRKAELRVRFLNKVKQNVFDEFIQRLEAAGTIRRSGEFIAAGDFEIPHDDTYARVESALIKALDAAGFEFLKLSDISTGVAPAHAEDILQLLAAEGKVVLLSEDLLTLPKYTDVVIAKAKEVLAAEGKITIAGLRDMIGTSRKNAKPLLEYLDSVKVTRRNGTESERVAY